MRKLNGKWTTIITSNNLAQQYTQNGPLYLVFEITGTIIAEHFIPDFSNIREKRPAQPREWILITAPQPHESFYERGDCFKVLERGDGLRFSGCRVRRTADDFVMSVPDAEYEVITNYKEI